MYFLFILLIFSLARRLISDTGRDVLSSLTYNFTIFKWLTCLVEFMDFQKKLWHKESHFSFRDFCQTIRLKERYCQGDLLPHCWILYSHAINSLRNNPQNVNSACYICIFFESLNIKNIDNYLYEIIYGDINILPLQ